MKKDYKGNEDKRREMRGGPFFLGATVAASNRPSLAIQDFVLHCAVHNDYPMELRFLTDGAKMADWEMVVSQHAAAIRRTAYRLVGNHADVWDCVQETFLEAVKIDRREPVRNWSALLRHLATVRALDLLRRRSRQRRRCHSEVDPAQVVSRAASPSGHAEANELADRLRAAVGQLPRRQAEVFCLICFEQMTTEEVAERMNISPTATRMLLSRARRRIQRLLEPFGDTVEKDERVR
ncbi:MAG: sigma-70 family RNA polymerase sigma factor [Thermoguttaceae bacterium]